MTYAKGQIGARWIATDENGDTLIYAVHIRGVKETAWKLLRDKVKEKYVSWDSTAYPDGEYRLRITASDLPGNPPAQALHSSLDSDVFLIDNTPPRITGLTATRNGAKLSVRWKAQDGLSVIAKSEYSVDGGEWLVTAPTTRLSDSRELDYDLTLDNIPAGEHTIAVRTPSIQPLFGPAAGRECGAIITRLPEGNLWEPPLRQAHQRQSRRDNNTDRI
jgi:hypothetical protein